MKLFSLLRFAYSKIYSVYLNIKIRTIMESIYQVLMQLPLFQGVSRNKLSEVIEKTRFHFLKYNNGELAVSRSEQCSHFKFLLSGSLRCESCTYDGKVRISQVIHAPNIIAPEHIFGKSTHYPANYYATDSAGLMQIDKATFLSFMQNEPIFLINLLNILSRRSQKTKEAILSISTGDMKERLAFWVLCLTERKATDIRIIAKQRDLYGYFGVQRAALLNALAELKQEKIIDFTPTEVAILDRSALRELLIDDIEFFEADE